MLHSESSDKWQKKIAIGIQKFGDIIKENCFYSHYFT